MLNGVYYSCEDHLDIVMDDFINKYEIFPKLELDKEINYCNYCDKYSKYIVTYYIN